MAFTVSLVTCVCVTVKASRRDVLTSVEVECVIRPSNSIYISQVLWRLRPCLFCVENLIQRPLVCFAVEPIFVMGLIGPEYLSGATDHRLLNCSYPDYHKNKE